MSLYTPLAEAYETIFPPRPATLAWLLAQAPAPGLPALDIGCGPGTYSGGLAAAGHPVTGLDLDPHMVAAARRACPTGTFHHLDMRAIDRLPGPFGLICCLGHTLAHLPPTDLGPFLSQVRRLLLPGGVWAWQVVNPAAGTGAPRDLPPLGDPAGRYRFERRHEPTGRNRVRFLTRLWREGRLIHHGSTTLYPLGRAALTRRHRLAGLEPAGCWGDFLGAPYRPAVSPALVMAWRRPGEPVGAAPDPLNSARAAHPPNGRPAGSPRGSSG